MATVELRDDTLQVRFTRGEKLAGLVRDLDIPVRSATGVAVVPDGLEGTRGMRAPGLALPGRRKIGTWRGRNHRTLVSVRSGEPALRISVAGERYDELLLGVEDAEARAALITAAIS